MKFSIRVHDGVEWKIAELDEEEVSEIQKQHDSWSKTILNRCLSDSENKEIQIILFNKRCPDFMDMIRAKLELKAAYLLKKVVKGTRKGDWITCPNCKNEHGKALELRKGYNQKYKYYCGKCKRFMVKWTDDELKIRENLASDGRGDNIRQTTI